MGRGRILRRVGAAMAAVLLMANTPVESPEALMAEGKEAEAFALVAERAATGDAIASAQLAWFYENGRVVNADAVRAAELYRKAAEQGDAYSRWRLGVMIDEGLAAGDTGEAVALFKQATHDGLTSAMNSLAVMYAMGRGVEQDYAMARTYYDMAARQGDHHGIQGLGVLYSRGEGVEKDPIEATAYWLIARQMGNEPAGSYFDGASASLSDEEKAQVLKRAREIAYELGLSGPPPEDAEG